MPAIWASPVPDDDAKKSAKSGVAAAETAGHYRRPPPMTSTTDGIGKDDHVMTSTTDGIGKDDHVMTSTTDGIGKDDHVGTSRCDCRAKRRDLRGTDGGALGPRVSTLTAMRRRRLLEQRGELAGVVDGERVRAAYVTQASLPAPVHVTWA